jgi:hypothetical protein
MIRLRWKLIENPSPVRFNGREGFDDRHARELAVINDQNGVSHHPLCPPEQRRP